MKKKLEAELISIAHRILKMKNKSDLMQLHLEAQKLYEKLSVLRFVEENLSDVKPTIGYAEVEDKIAVIFDKDTAAEAPVATEAKTADKGEVLKEIISGIGENAKQVEPEVAQETKENVPAAGEQTSDNEASIEAPASPEESVAAAELQATEESKTEESKEDTEQTPDQTPEPVVEAPEKIEEPAEEKEPAIKAEPAEAKPEQSFKPAFEWGFEAKEETKSEEAKITPAQISFDDLLGQDYVDPVFVKPEEVETPIPAKTISEDERRAAELAESNRRLADLREGKRPAEFNESKNVIPISRNFSDTSNVIPISKSENLNDRMSKGITIGLNDRIAFMKHLFNNSSEDYNRVLSQLITLDTLSEAKNFIDTMVKPDYNNWEGKEEYEQRFMEIVEKKFS